MSVGLALTGALSVVAVALGGALTLTTRRLRAAGRRQDVLDELSSRLAGTPATDAVAEAVVEAASGLVPLDSSWSAFLVAGPDEVRVMAAAGPVPYDRDEGGRAQLVADWGSRAPEAGEAGPGRLSVPVVVHGTVRAVLVVGRPARQAGADDGLRAVCRQAAAALEVADAIADQEQRAERRFRSLVRNAAEAVTLLGPDGVIFYQSAGGRSVLGLADGSLLGQTFVPLTHPDDVALTRAQFVSVLRGGPGARAEFECRLRHADGSWRQLETVLTNLLDDPDVGAVVSNSRDVTDRRELERQLSHQAFHDSLTGLANRALFLDRVGHALGRVDRGPTQVAVMFIDIDDFKVVNDSRGHHLGDRILVAVGDRLKAATRPGDTVARLGGDEFAVLLDSGEMPAGAETVANRIAASLAVPIKVGHDDIPVRASIGISMGRPGLDSPDSLLRDADLAMYMAKRNGKGCFEMFHPAMHEEAVRRLETAADLRRSIEEGGLEIHFQPVIEVASGALSGAEALVRWHHPQRGLVGPAEFISVAESTGLVVPLGRWVLREACEQVSRWRRTGVVDDTFSVSVNLSARQLQDPSLLADVEDTLRDAGLPAGALVLEVTESMIIDDLDATLVRLQALKELGLHLAVDDFGTGYSSLRYLQSFPMDIVKIDKAFTDRLTVDAEGTAMVRAVVELSRALGLITIAEGVEQADQLDVLRRLGCAGAQGYLVARPMPGGAFADFASGRRSDAARGVWSGVR